MNLPTIFMTKGRMGVRKGSSSAEHKEFRIQDRNTAKKDSSRDEGCDNKCGDNSSLRNLYKKILVHLTSLDPNRNTDAMPVLNPDRHQWRKTTNFRNSRCGHHEAISLNFFCLKKLLFFLKLLESMLN